MKTMETLLLDSMEVEGRALDIRNAIESMYGKTQYVEEIRDLLNNIKGYLRQIENILIRID